MPIGVPGEMYVGGAGVARGLSEPTRTHGGAFRAAPVPRQGATLYRTGDLARFLPGEDSSTSADRPSGEDPRLSASSSAKSRPCSSRHEAVREAFVTVAREGADKRMVAYLVGAVIRRR